MLLILALAGAAQAELYRVVVSRIDSNLYKDHNTGVVIETKYCYEYATRDEAVLRYEQYSYDNKLIFSSGTTCEVKALR